MTKLTIHITLSEDNGGFWLAKAGNVYGEVSTGPVPALASLVTALGLEESGAIIIEDETDPLTKTLNQWQEQALNTGP